MTEKIREQLSESIKLRIAKLNDAIFNGNNSTFASFITLRKNIKFNTVEHYLIKLNTNNGNIDIVKYYDDKDLEKDNDMFFKPYLENWSYSTDNEPDKLRRLIFHSNNDPNLTNDIRKNTFTLKYSNNCGYKLSLNTIITKNMEHETIKQYCGSAISGNIVRYFEQTLMEIPESIDTLVIIYTNTYRLPIVFGYDTISCNSNGLIDLNEIFSENITNCIYSSYDKQFSYKDDYIFRFSENIICSDSNFLKVNSVMNNLISRNESITKVTDSNTEYFEYINNDILGSFDIDGSYVEYFVEGYEQDYMIYSTRENYGISLIDFLNCIEENIKNNFELSSEEKTKGLDLLYNSLIYNSQIPLMDSEYINGEEFNKNVKVFKDICCNKNTYHFYFTNNYNTKIIATLYNGEYLAVRDYMESKYFEGVATRYNLYKLSNNCDETFKNIINSIISFRKNNTVEYFDYGNYTLYNEPTNYIGSIIRYFDKESNDFVKKFIYTSKEIENCEIVFIKNGTIEITKFNSLLYNINEKDQIIFRNYLGLPINYKYI